MEVATIWRYEGQGMGGYSEVHECDDNKILCR